mmetsp:Transcript_23830/g.94483  ORF Transcript_23830/g.94483 Transcript_23830/m.94483 type:complete len:92 (-) Transcript_23830:306-581(-)
MSCWAHINDLQGLEPEARVASHDDDRQTTRAQLPDSIGGVRGTSPSKERKREEKHAPVAARGDHFGGFEGTPSPPATVQSLPNDDDDDDEP